MTTAAAGQRLAMLVSFSGVGGVEKMMVNLCREFVTRGVEVDLILIRAESAHLKALPAAVRVHCLRARHAFSAVFELIQWLRRERPKVLLVAKDRAGRAAWLARKISRVDCRLVLRIGTTLSAALAGKSWWRKFAWYLPMRLIYPGFDRIIAVSAGVAADLVKITGLPENHFAVLANPVLSPEIFAHARQPAALLWLNDKTRPVIIASGRLTRQKDFPTLLRAFAVVRAELDCCLVILGEGEDRETLASLARQLQIESDLLLPGFEKNPYALMARADLFVLSSLWEGSPNVLTEALGLGLPVVSTDCPSGPRELLGDACPEVLVPPGDHQALARAMLVQLRNSRPPSFWRSLVQDYQAATAAAAYLKVLFPVDS